MAGLIKFYYTPNPNYYCYILQAKRRRHIVNNVRYSPHEIAISLLLFSLNPVGNLLLGVPNLGSGRHAMSDNPNSLLHTNHTGVSANHVTSPFCSAYSPDSSPC